MAEEQRLSCFIPDGAVQKANIFQKVKNFWGFVWKTNQTQTNKEIGIRQIKFSEYLLNPFFEVRKNSYLN
jgi:hypothetical protein